MKTVFEFEESISKEKVILRHPKDVEITKETRKDHIEWTDSEGNKITDRAYIVIRFPKTKPVDWTKWTRKKQDDWHLGYKRNDSEDMTELLFYDQITFSWVVRQLEDMGLLKVTQRMMLNWRKGYLFPCYINARGIGQISYNLMTMLLQLPFVLYRNYQHDQELKKFETKHE